MAKNNSKNSRRTNSSQSGKKGGASTLNPEIIGAMTGAAIGGLAGMILGSQKAREKLALAKDKALETASDVLENIDTTELKSQAKKTTDEVIEKTQDIKKQLPERAKKN